MIVSLMIKYGKMILSEALLFLYCFLPLFNLTLSILLTVFDGDRIPLNLDGSAMDFWNSQIRSIGTCWDLKPVCLVRWNLISMESWCNFEETFDNINLHWLILLQKLNFCILLHTLPIFVD